MMHAAAFTSFETNALQSSGSTYLAAEGSIPGAMLYVLTGPTHAGGADVFCQGVWMAVGITAVDTVTCAQAPASAAMAESVAQNEYRVAKGVEPGGGGSSLP
jgi:hypothetical protein